jgi:hypothetical protein
MVPGDSRGNYAGHHQGPALRLSGPFRGVSGRRFLFQAHRRGFGPSPRRGARNIVGWTSPRPVMLSAAVSNELTASTCAAFVRAFSWSKRPPVLLSEPTVEASGIFLGAAIAASSDKYTVGRAFCGGILRATASFSDEAEKTGKSSRSATSFDWPSSSIPVPVLRCVIE